MTIKPTLITLKVETIAYGRVIQTYYYLHIEYGLITLKPYCVAVIQTYYHSFNIKSVTYKLA